MGCIDLNAIAGRPKESFGLDPVRFDEMIPGCYDVTERIKDLDLERSPGPVVRPVVSRIAVSTFIRAKDRDLAPEWFKAWNGPAAGNQHAGVQPSFL